MQDATLGPFLIVSGLLVVSGAFKVVSPGGIAAAMNTTGRTLPRWMGRGIGVAEMGLGMAAIAVPGPVPGGLVGALYLVLAGVVLTLRRRGAESCGCFGEISSPPSLVHFGYNLVAAAIAASHALGGGSPPVESWGAGAPGGPPLLAAMAALGIATSLVLLTALPALLAETARARAVARARHDREHPKGHSTAVDAPVRST